jgi:hypothetical protein
MKRVYTENYILGALDAIAYGVSRQRASLNYGVPRTAFRNCSNSHETYQKTAVFLQNFSPVQEKRLTDWVLVLGNLGLSPTHTQIKDFAQRLLVIQGDIITLGKR